MSPSAAARRDRFDELYHDTFSDVAAYCRRRCQSADDANDAVADVFLVGWRKIDEVSEADKPIAWLIAVARGVLLNQRRSEGRRRRLATRLSWVRSERLEIEPAAAAEGNEAVLAVFERLRSLRPLDQEIVALAALEGLSYDEIGVVVNKSPSVVKTRLYRARKELRATASTPPPTSKLREAQ